MITLDARYWTERYTNQQTGWDANAITTPLKEYFDQLKNKNISILIPGCGNAHEAEYLHKQGFQRVFLADISDVPLENFAQRVPDFPHDQLINEDFFLLEGKYDLIVEQTFFCALDPAMRKAYVKKMHELLKPSGRLVGLLFNDSLNDDHPPFGGSAEEYKRLFEDYFEFEKFEIAHNSIAPRAGRELFIQFKPLPVIPKL
jgi:methyl halide transferase